MALFTDPNVITLDDLLRFESSLNQVSTSQSIDVSTKIQIATDNIGDRLLLGLLRAGLYNPTVNYGVNIGLQSVIVTPALYRWLCFEALSRVYAEAYNAQLNTRFQGKWTEYQKQAEVAASLVLATGLSVVLAPLPRPSLPNVIVAAGTVTSPAVFVQTTWVDSKGQESAPSAINGAVLNGFSSVQVSPGNSLTSIPANIIGWNIYASLTQQNLTIQNTQAMALGSVWQMPNLGLANGAVPSGGQKADILVPISNHLQRG